jgi:hypothetical protein
MASAHTAAYGGNAPHGSMSESVASRGDGQGDAYRLRRYRLGSGDVLYFLHVAKTAGLSFSYAVESHFRPEEVCALPTLEEVFRLAPPERDRIRLFRGHYSYYLPRLLGRAPLCVTLLRNPMDQVVSLYQFIRETTGHPFERVGRDGLSLDAFVNDPEFVPLLWNHQTTNLLLDHDLFAPDWLADVTDADAADRRRFLHELHRHLLALPQAELLDRAVARLDGFAFVGITERLRETLRLLAYTFGWDELAETPRLNVTNWRVDQGTVAQPTSAAIHELTRLDAALYAHARELFAARYEQMLRDQAAEAAQRGGEPNRPVVRMDLLSPLPPPQAVALTVRSCPRSAVRRGTFRVRVRLVNRTAFTFNSFLPHPIYLSYHWGDEPNTGVVEWNGERTRLWPPLPPGGHDFYQANVVAPPHAGRYTLNVTLVQEGGHWFDQPPTCVWSSRQVGVV